MRLVKGYDKYNDWACIYISLADDEIPLQGYKSELDKLEKKEDSKVFMYGVSPYDSMLYFNVKKHSYRKLAQVDVMTITYDRNAGKVTFKCGDDFHYSQEGLPSDKDYGIRVLLQLKT